MNFAEPDQEKEPKSSNLTVCNLRWQPVLQWTVLKRTSNSESVYTLLSISWKVISWIMKHVCQILFSVVRSASFPIIQKSKAFIIFLDIFSLGCNNKTQKVFRKCSILLSFLYKTPIKTRLIAFQSHRLLKKWQFLQIYDKLTSAWQLPDNCVIFSWLSNSTFFT